MKQDKLVLSEWEWKRIAYIYDNLEKFKQNGTDMSNWEAPFMLDVIRRLAGSEWERIKKGAYAA